MTPGVLPLPLFLPLPLRERARGEGACSHTVIPAVSNAVIPDISNTVIPDVSPIVIPDVINRESKARGEGALPSGRSPYHCHPNRPETLCAVACPGCSARSASTFTAKDALNAKRLPRR